MTTEIYLVRHGKTMFNALHRAQGWCDTPLTPQGSQMIHFLGLGLRETPFDLAVSSDSGRAMETMRIILGEHHQGRDIPYSVDNRIREWCFGSLEGGFDDELWGVLPRVMDFKNSDEMWDANVSFEQIANAIQEADTAAWSEPYAQIRDRVYGGFEDIAHRLEKNGGGRALTVSHGFTIAFLLNLIDPAQPVRVDIDNGSVTKLTYTDGKFSIEEIGSLGFILKGQSLSHELLS